MSEEWEKERIREGESEQMSARRGRDGEEGEEESQNKKNYNFWSAAIGNRRERR